MATAKTYKVRKGDKLEAVAKTHGHSDWRAIWKAPENRVLAGKRGKPEDLQPGDLLVIPPTEGQLREEALKLAGLAASREVDAGLRAYLIKETKRIPRLIQMYDENIASRLEYTRGVLGELDAGLQRTKAWAQGVDVAADVLRMARDLEKLRRAQRATAKAAGDALKRINDEAREGLELIGKGKAEGDAVKAIALLKDDARMPLAIAGILADSWDKVQSPSFWANAIVQKWEGRSWSDAVTNEVGSEIEARRTDAKLFAAKVIADFRAAQNAHKARLATMLGLLKACEARLKGYEQQMAALR